MNRPRAWRFLHPDFEPPGGLEISSLGRIDMVEGDLAIRQALRLLISTAPGERVMRPAYGCNLRTLVYAPNDDSTAGLAIHHVRQAILRWEPRVELLEVDARRDEFRPSFLVLRVRYQVRATLRHDELGFGLSLTGD